MQKILSELKKRGYRLTQSRQQIVTALTSHPQSVSQIITKLRTQNISIDTVTVYRTLDMLTNQGIVSKTTFDHNTALYELASADHHHHLICNDCGAIEDIAFDEQMLLNQVHQQSSFQITSHALEFFGRCPNCQ